MRIGEAVVLRLRRVGGAPSSASPSSADDGVWLAVTAGVESASPLAAITMRSLPSAMLGLRLRRVGCTPLELLRASSDGDAPFSCCC
jgi:hypothetical protein